MTDPPNDFQAVIDLVVQQERKRIRRGKRRRRRLRQEDLAKRRSDQAKFYSAIQAIRWCVISITVAIFLVLTVAIVAIFKIDAAMDDLERDVEQITDRVDSILEEVEHPFEGAGKLLGRDLDKSIGEFFGLTPAQ